MNNKILFLNSHRAKSGIINGVKLSKAYVLAAKFFDCGIIDRTRSLDMEFDYQLIDEIPAIDPAFSKPFAQICDERAIEILREADSKGKKIQVLWSGGIDSTVALIALTQNQKKANLYPTLEVLLTMHSINEYPLFFNKFILSQIPFKPVAAPITDFVDEGALIVTGEHGDQLFGSDKLLPLIENGLAFQAYEKVLPIYLMNKFKNQRKSKILIDYLQPLIQACPKPVHSMHDLFWWLNFTIKWQQVALRLAVFSGKKDTKAFAEQFRHFYASTDFQKWSLAGREAKMIKDLASYKLPAKKYILNYTNDLNYFSKKSKEPSLKNVIINRKKQGSERYRVSMTTDFQPHIELFHTSFKNKNITS